MIQAAVEQYSDKGRIWVTEFQPLLAGLEVSWPEWTLWARGEAYTVPADRFTLESGPHDQLVRLWLSPREEDGYLHLDVVPQDGEHENTRPEAFGDAGCVLLLWGMLQAGASEPELHVLRHVEDAG